jgi:hypothetical protein
MARPSATGSLRRHAQDTRRDKPYALSVLDGLPFPAAAYLAAMCGGGLTKTLLAPPPVRPWSDKERTHQS